MNKPEAPDRVVGHQYLFVAIPFGSVEIDYPGEYLHRAAYEQLSLAGFRPIIGPSHMHLPKLLLTVRELQLTAYDFLFVRRLFAKVTIGFRFIPPGESPQEILDVTETESSYERFGFRRQLARVFDRALARALDTVISETRRLYKD